MNRSTVDNIINPELEKKAPTVVAFLKKFQWKPGEIDSVMLGNHERREAGRRCRCMDQRSRRSRVELD